MVNTTIKIVKTHNATYYVDFDEDENMMWLIADFALFKKDVSSHPTKREEKD